MSIPFLSVGAAIDEIRPEIDAAIDRVLSSGWMLLGRELETFEREWAGYCQAEHAIGVSNGLDALHLIFRAFDIGAGDEVIVPSNTYIASWLSVSQAGACPVPVEPIEATYCIDPERIARAITPRTKAIMVVHLYGHPGEMQPILEIAAKFGLKVIEDAAQCHGARYQGRRIGAHGHAVAWSFYPTKNLGALGDAGAVTTSDPVLADKLRLLRNYGSRVRYVNEVVGYNNRLEEIHAAILSVKLTHLDEWNERRSRLAECYHETLADLGLRLPKVYASAEHAWHIYAIRHPRRDELKKTLESLGVNTLIHYPIPPHLQTAYANLGYKQGDFPISEKIHSEILSLPIGPHLSAQDQASVISAVKEAVCALSR